MIHVINKHHKLPRAEGATYISVSRPSALGNEYTHLPGTSAQYLVGSREEAVALYRSWLVRRIDEKDILVCYELNKIYFAAKKGDVYLECYCFPKNCHATVIKDIIQSKLDASMANS